MNLDQLRVFLAVARHLHFSRAADELYITQPAVSAAVAKLESQYGVRLFHRIGRRVEITDVGRFLVSEASRLLDRVELLEQGLQEFNNLQRGVLSLGASLTVGNYWLPTRLKAFWDRHAGIELRCSLANAEQVLEGTAQGQFDLCFLSGWPAGGLDLRAAGLLCAEEVGQEQLLVVVGRGHPWFGMPLLTPEQLRESTWVMREKGSGAQSLLENVLAEVDVPIEQLSLSLVLNSSEMVRAIVLEGGSAAALPEPMVRQEVELGLLWPMTIEGCTRHRQPIWMVKHRQRYGTRLLLAFEQLVRGGGVNPADPDRAEPAVPAGAGNGSARQSPPAPDAPAGDTPSAGLGSRQGSR